MEEEKNSKIEKLEKEVDSNKNNIKENSNKINSLERVQDAHSSQIARLMSHIESEVGLARKEMNAFIEKLFGKGDDEYGGRFGQLLKRVSKLELLILSLGTAAVLITFLIMVYKFFVESGK